MFRFNKLCKIHVPCQVSLLLGSLLLFALLPYVSLFGVKPWYISIFASGVFFLNKGNIKIPNCPVFILIIWSIIVSLTSGLVFFGIQRQFVNYCLAIPLISFTYSFVLIMGKARTEKVARNVALIFATLILINTVRQIDLIMKYLASSYLNHPEIESISVGGFNLDATWLAIFSVLFCSSKYKYLFLGYSFLISGLYNCRVAIIVDIFILFWFMYKDKKNIKKIIMLICGVFPILLFVASNTNTFEKVITRFSGIGSMEEAGSLGRLRMWINVPDVISNYPFGVGMGNSIGALIKVSGYPYDDANFHNLIMEFFGQTGIVGGIIYLSLIITLFIYTWKIRKRIAPFHMMLCCYVLAGMFEFSGCESFIFLVVGLFWGVYKIDNKTIKERYLTGNKTV